MARVSKSKITKLEIIRVALHMFLDRGYSNTSIKAICDELDISTGNLTFYFPSKEHLLAVLVDLLCDFQWKLMEREADEGYSSVMALCFELMAMASACETDAIAKDIYISAYTSPLALEIIRKNDANRAKKVFKDYRSDWTDEQYSEAETLVSGIEYATLMTTADSASLELRISGALHNILGVYGVPEETRNMKIKKILSMDYHGVGQRIMKEFKAYVDEFNENALEELKNL